MLSLEAGEEGTPLPVMRPGKGWLCGVCAGLGAVLGVRGAGGGLAGVSATGSSSKPRQVVPLSPSSSPAPLDVWLIGTQ